MTKPTKFLLTKQGIAPNDPEAQASSIPVSIRRPRAIRKAKKTGYVLWELLFAGAPVATWHRVA